MKAVEWFSRKSCKRKVRYTNALAAFQRLIDMTANGTYEPTLRVYLCPMCDGYHLGRYRIHRSEKRDGKHARRLIISKLLARVAP